jgi:hypothetical protein
MSDQFKARVDYLEFHGAHRGSVVDRSQTIIWADTFASAQLAKQAADLVAEKLCEIADSQPIQ